MSWYQKISWSRLALTVFWLSAFVATHLPKIPRAVAKVSDKTWHFGTYAVLSFLLSWVLFSRFQGVARHALAVIVILATYGAIDEVLQIPVGRSCDVHDWIADMIGVTVGWVAFQVALLLSQSISRARG